MKTITHDLPGAVFLDRDGTINPDEGYIGKPSRFRLYPFAAESIRRLNALGFYVFIVTNQSGIGRGYYTLENMFRVHCRMMEMLKLENALIDRIYFSPYHPKGIVPPWNRFDDSRKPGLGMYRQACREFMFDPRKSFMAGDRESDIEFGRNAGLTTFLVRTGQGDEAFLERRANWKASPHFIVPNLKSVVDVIERLVEQS